MGGNLGLGIRAGRGGTVFRGCPEQYGGNKAANNAGPVLSSIKRACGRAYDLCRYKLDRISNGWITPTNVLIGLTIRIVTVLFWMEFWG